MNLFESLGIDGSYLVLALLVINVALIAIVILLFTRQKKMKYNLSVFMNGKDAESLEDAMVEKFTEINEINRLGKASAREISEIKDKHKFAFQKFSIVKYDAFVCLPTTMTVLYSLPCTAQAKAATCILRRSLPVKPTFFSARKKRRS